MNEETLSGRGGRREGAGRKKGSTKEPTVVFYARVTPAQKKLLEEYLRKIKNQDIK